MGEVIMGLLLLLLTFIIGGMCGGAINDSVNHREAIAAGVGEYYLDTENVRHFRYTKTPIHPKAEHE